MQYSRDFSNNESEHSGLTTTTLSTTKGFLNDIVPDYLNVAGDCVVSAFLRTFANYSNQIFSYVIPFVQK